MKKSHFLSLGALVFSMVLLPYSYAQEAKVDRPLSTKTPIEKTVTKLIKSKEKGKPFLKSFRTIVALGPSAVPTLAELAANQTMADHQRWTCVRAVGRIGDRQAIPGLLELFKDPNPLIRIGALRALGDLGAVQVLSEIQAIGEKDEAMVVRNEAVKVLGRFKDERSLPILEKAFWDERNFIKGQSLFIRRHVVVSLGKIQSRQSIPILIKALEDHDETIPPSAVRSLERISGLRFDAENQTTVHDHWKKWWEEEIKRIPPITVPLSSGKEISQPEGKEI